MTKDRKPIIYCNKCNIYLNKDMDKDNCPYCGNDLTNQIKEFERFINLKSNECIIDKWNNGMIIYKQGIFDPWNVSIRKGNNSFIPHIYNINCILSDCIKKMGTKDFCEFKEKIQNISGDPRSIDTKNEIYRTIKDYEKYFKNCGINTFCNNWNLTFPRFCLTYYAIIFAKRREKWHQKPEVQEQWNEWGINKSSFEAESEIEEEYEKYIEV